MRYMMLYKPGRESDAPPTQQEMAAMGELIGDMVKSGVLLATDGLLSSAHGARVRITGDGFAVTDGPFTEAKELVGGFAIVQVKSKQEAIDLAKRFLKVVGEGESEIRLMTDTPAFPPEASVGTKRHAEAPASR